MVAVMFMSVALVALLCVLAYNLAVYPFSNFETALGEIHRGSHRPYLGRQYRLKVVPHVQAAVKLTRGFIVLQTHRPNSTEVTRELVDAWYRERAHVKFAERTEHNLGRFPDPEAFRPRGLIVRQIKQR